MLLRAIGLGPNLVNTEDSFCTQMGGLLELLELSLGSENKDVIVLIISSRKHPYLENM